MSSEAIVACISPARLHAELFATDSRNGTVFEELFVSLSFLKTFVLCGKKLRNDARFKHFLLQIEERLQKESEGFLRASDASLGAERFKNFTESLHEEMGEWFVTMLDCSCIPHSTSLMINEIMEIITSVLEIIVNCREELYPLTLQLTFLNSLVYFVTKGSTEARKDLLAHSETIAINTASVLFHGFCRLCKSSDDDFSSTEIWEELFSAVSPWVQKMKPTDPQVYEMYTQSLVGSKLSKQSLDDDDDLLALKNFIGSLLSTLSDILFTNTCHVVSMKDQLEELYGRLISLKIFLKQHHIANFDMEIQKEIVDVVTDIGISICSLYQPQIDVKFGHQHLLDKLKTVMSTIAEMDPHRPIFNSPRTSSYGFVDSILEKLSEMTRSNPESTITIHVQTIQVELASIRYKLGDVVKLLDEQVEVQTLWDRLLEVAFKVEGAIDYQAINPLSDFFSTSFDSIIEDIFGIKADVLKIEVNEAGRATNSYLPAQTTLSASNDVIGFQDEERTILDRLRGGSQQLRVIAIVGMPGLGKTTLAKKVYNHSSLSSYFSAKAWCTISQVLDRKYVLLDLLKQISPVDIPSEISEHDLADQLRRSLKGKRYLIFLDDIWTTEEWSNLKDSFPNDTKGSRIIFTSRSLDVAPREMLDEEPLILSPLNEKDSLKLMCNKLFPKQGYVLPPALHDLGVKIVARCRGLPLAIIILAGVLENAEAEAWDGVLGSFSFLSSEDNCRCTLEFSYRYLPDYLKPCFLYFGVFPEDQEISVWKLLRLWIAEGFIRKSEASSLENVAEGYLNMLIGRSLIMVAKQRSDGGVKTCRIHDLLHEFCLEKAKDEHFFHFGKGSVELYSFNEAPILRRLLIDSDPNALRESKFYCPHARSLLSRGPERFLYNGMLPRMLQFFKLLKVLDLEKISIGSVFPTGIEQLLLLAFLAINGCGFTIPLWLANLSNLETLIIRVHVASSWLFKLCKLSLPDNLWKMKKLKYLYIASDGGGVLPIDKLDDSPVLYELERFTGATIEWCSMEKQLRKFPNIHKLKCLLLGNMSGREYVDKFAFSDFSSKLESLGMCGSPELDFGVRFEFASLANLKKLKLSQLYLYWEIFSIMGNQLPNLEVLKLEQLKFKDGEECVWEMKWGEFSKLRILVVDRMPIRRWIASDDHEFECFQKLVLYRCDMLEELPCCLESLETLDAIEVRYCSEAIEDLVAKIGAAQKEDWGNSGLEIIVRS